MPQVTVVIPCYNHGAFLQGAVDSVLGQTFQDFEILIVDDGSTEKETTDLLSRFSAPKTTVLHKRNGHLASARNFGIQRSDSPYILPLDADDTLEPTFAAKAIERIEDDEKIGAVTCNARTFGAGPSRIVEFPGGGLEQFLCRNRSLACCLIRKQCWSDAGGYDEGMKEGYEDWNFWLAATRRGWTVASIPEPLYNYRQSPDSMVTQSDAKRPRLVRQIVQNHREAFADHVDLVIYEKELQIQRLRGELDGIKRSWPNRLARCLANPFALLGRLRNRRKNST